MPSLKKEFRDYKIDTDNQYFDFHLWDKFHVYVYFQWCEEQSEYEIIEFDLTYKNKAIETFEIDFDLEKTTQIEPFKEEVIEEIKHFFSLEKDPDENDRYYKLEKRRITDKNLLKIENQISQIDITERNYGVSQEDIGRYYQGRCLSSNDAVKSILHAFTKEEREDYFHDSIFDCRKKEYFNSVFDTFQEVGCLVLKNKHKVFIHESSLFKNVYFLLENQDY